MLVQWYLDNGPTGYQNRKSVIHYLTAPIKGRLISGPKTVIHHPTVPTTGQMWQFRIPPYSSDLGYRSPLSEPNSLTGHLEHPLIEMDLA